jgi:DNA (cytosine-5)-methyltransferase 3A
MNVLSLFDGISCGQIALNKAGIKYDNYYASEINKYSIQVTSKNYPDTIQLGNVSEINVNELPNIDLLIGGSPCQSFSNMGDNTGFEGKSKLFWEFVRILNEVKPKYFLLENVVMKKEWQDVISEAVGVKPIKINSALLSHQRRNRLYWTNIPGITQPNDLDLDFRDIIEQNVHPKYNLTKRAVERVREKQGYDLVAKKAKCLFATYYKNNSNSREGQIVEQNGVLRRLTPNECEILQTVPLNYTDCLSDTQRYKTLGDGWTVDVIAHIFERLKEPKKRKLTVLSLFDGMSCGQIALNKAGIEYDNYYASEIDKHAISVTQYNYPNTIQMGSITELKSSQLPKIDLLFGGSPCQSFSNAGNGTGFDGKSGLFYEYVRLLKECKPTYFMLENVKMKKEWQDIISDELGVQPIKINSNLVGAQNRERLYWSNIPIVGLPNDKEVYIEDILDITFDSKYWLKERNSELLSKKVNIEGAPAICCIDVYNKKYKKDRKSPTLTLPHHNSLRLLQDGKFRKLTPNECERLQTVPVDYTNIGISDIHRYSMLGNGWTVDVIAHIFQGLKE